MNVKLIQSLFIITNLMVFSCQADSRRYTVLKTAEKGAQSIGVYKRAKIGKDGAYGTFTKKGTPLSQTVIESNTTSDSRAEKGNQKAVGYIQNINPGAQGYISLYPYQEAIPQPKKASPTKLSAKMQTANYTQKK